MGFINEFVPEDQKSKFDLEVFDWGVAHPPIRPYRWVVDHERDIFLMVTGNTGHGGKPTTFFSYSYQKHLIKFKAEINLLGDSESGWTANWWIFDFKMPNILESKKEDVIKVLLEAIEIHGNSVGLTNPEKTILNISFAQT